ncbi:MAG: hypothetical protein KJO62_02925 [Gammaproteobacteria bacterium]|nr:hypothetical protein [Gammaproteobacteria bacterium]
MPVGETPLENSVQRGSVASEPNLPAPLYNRIRELFSRGFRIDWGNTLFISITHLVFLIGTPLAYWYAPEGMWKIMLAWTILHMLVGCLSTTVYAHRLIAHGAAKNVSWPVHILFGFIGQVFAIQGSVRRWAAMHTVHHGVDKSGKHHLDPYSATWFNSTWRNFLWSHMLTYFFWHPDHEAIDKAFSAKSSPALMWQEKLYLPLLVLLNFLLPMAVGYWVAGLTGALCLQVAAVGGFILAQHNTWTVNSITHLWGSDRAAISSARNNYIWMGPLGEGNHHADHHDHGQDYRNGFGWSGWLLDPSRYVILLLRAFGLVRGLRRASMHKEVQIVARRALQNARSKIHDTNWRLWEGKLQLLQREWIDATRSLERYRAECKELRAVKRKAKSRLPASEFSARLSVLREEIDTAKKQMRERKQAFFVALAEACSMPYARA